MLSFTVTPKSSEGYKRLSGDLNSDLDRDRIPCEPLHYKAIYLMISSYPIIIKKDKRVEYLTPTLPPPKPRLCWIFLFAFSSLSGDIHKKNISTNSLALSLARGIYEITSHISEGLFFKFSFSCRRRGSRTLDLWLIRPTL